MIRAPTPPAIPPIIGLHLVLMETSSKLSEAEEEVGFVEEDGEPLGPESEVTATVVVLGGKDRERVVVPEGLVEAKEVADVEAWATSH